MIPPEPQPSPPNSKPFTIGNGPRPALGHRGEYWVLLQGLLLLALVLVPKQPIADFIPISQTGKTMARAIAGVLGGIGMIAVLRGIIDLGKNLTPLPYPRSEGQLVQAGIYGWVRHPLYSGLILLTLAWSCFTLSWSQLLISLILALILNAKASREEQWLTEKYPEYSSYCQQVKKLIPWLY
jgi:protein-S-isoprenylcysteine O-methyltransferase Ste14